ncbi:ABC-2 transporter permease [Anaerovorax odorimutans]|uniref:ABC-2 transporter permease n=1 Tax=Anaerovorax odorimutans TaxID=109327 RepID=A0ABT1RM54_9FIRM|nr:ABC-2 transporter permease [Anaerovorax odorimutans]MCQ4636262.1 ABC-2 transporter permease [Anaerovorax odorimutans]
MLHLIKKDFLIQKRNLAVAVAFIVFLNLFAKQGSTFAFVLSVLGVTYILVLGSGDIEQKNDCNIILVSLPIKRSTIVLSKYLSIVIFAILAVVVDLVVQRVIMIFGLPVEAQTIPSEIIVLSLVGAAIYCSVVLPLTYKFNVMTANVAGGALLLLLLGSSDFLLERIPVFLSDSNISDFQIALAVISFAVVIMLISYLISLKLFKDREF